MNFAYCITVISGFASLLPAAAGWWRLRQVHPAFYPFILLLTTNFIAEMASFFVIGAAGSNTAWYNIYALLSSLLIAWQVFKWAPGREFATGVQCAVLLLALLWLFAWYHTGIHKSFTGYFLASALVIAGGNFYLLYRRLPDLGLGIRKDAVVLISSGWLILYVFDFITELLISSGRWWHTPALPYLKPIFSLINVVVIFIQLIAVIWIPPRTPS